MCLRVIKVKYVKMYNYSLRHTLQMLEMEKQLQYRGRFRGSLLGSLKPPPLCSNRHSQLRSAVQSSQIGCDFKRMDVAFRKWV